MPGNQLPLFGIKGWLAAFYAVFLLLPAWAGADDRVYRPFERIVVFGTSLSDPGNAYLLLRAQGLPATSTPPYTDLVPSAPYAVGGNRFSNGPTWIEQLAAPIGLGWSVKAAFLASVDGSSNYAVGGTRARNGVAGKISLLQQVQRFLQDGGPRDSSRELYVIEMGGNDVRDALELRDPSIIGAALEAVADAITTLQAAAVQRRARVQFLVWTVPNLGRAPAVTLLDLVSGAGGTIVGFAGQLSSGYNAGLAALVVALSAQGVDIVPFNAYATLEDVADHPMKFRLKDVKNPCIVLGTVPPAATQCSNPDRFLFWDGVHPTKAGHAILAIENGKALIADLLTAH